MSDKALGSLVPRLRRESDHADWEPNGISADGDTLHDVYAAVCGLVDAPMTENRPFRKSRSECFSRSCAGSETWTRHTDDEMPPVPMRDARQRHNLAQSQPRRGRPQADVFGRVADTRLHIT